MIEGEDPFLPFGCFEPAILLAFGKVALLALFFYIVASWLGLWPN